MIDHVIIRNRSHAIESILREGLNPSVSTAVILAGGNMNSDTHPALLPMDDKALIFITLEHLTNFGIRRIFLLTGSTKAAFRKALGNDHVFGARVIYAHEKEPLRTAGAVKAIEDQLCHEPFLVIHADVLTNINLADFIAFHK